VAGSFITAAFNITLFIKQLCKMLSVSQQEWYIDIFLIFFMFLLQEIVHNKGVCYMYLKDSEKVCNFMHVIFSTDLQVGIYCV